MQRLISAKTGFVVAAVWLFALSGVRAEVLSAVEAETGEKGGGIEIRSHSVLPSFSAFCKIREARALLQIFGACERKTADYVLVEKRLRRLSLWSKGEEIGVYSIRLGRNPEGPKTEQGDGRTPEGRYRIDGRNPNSAFYLSLHISYPSASDRDRARKKGKDPGGEIVIHGFPRETDRAWMEDVHRQIDWTEGCIAVTDAEIKDLWDRIADNAIIDIVP